jgi:hypothetical protein
MAMRPAPSITDPLFTQDCQYTDREGWTNKGNVHRESDFGITSVDGHSFVEDDCTNLVSPHFAE